MVRIEKSDDERSLCTARCLVLISRLRQTVPVFCRLCFRIRLSKWCLRHISNLCCGECKRKLLRKDIDTALLENYGCVIAHSAMARAIRHNLSRLERQVRSNIIVRYGAIIIIIGLILLLSALSSFYDLQKFERDPEKSLERRERESEREDESGKSGVVPAPEHVDIDKSARQYEGPGEMGRPVNITKEMLGKDEQSIFKRGYDKNSFNQYASDMISLKRSLPDLRSPECKAVKYPEDLPDTSVIVCFHNEAWSTLLRSVHSIINRSPPHLLKEVILVDDASDQPHLKKKLDDYFSKYKKVKVVRAKERVGLIKARLMGFEVSTGKVATFLDSHIECSPGWLEPMLYRISQDWSNVVWPVIDIINFDTLEYKNDTLNSVNVGGFAWDLTFNWHKLPDRDNKTRKSAADPIRSPTMAGGLFAIDRKYFERLGKYDPDFDIWGGENLELSFKTWMCGGTLELIPCSRVGHIFREKSPYKWRDGKDALKKNLVRLAEVWLDDYKKHYYTRIGDLGDFGDISERVALRKQLGCKSFDWYLKTIFPELFIPDQAAAWGEVRNDAEQGKYCMDWQEEKKSNKSVVVWPCHGQGGNQYWSYTNDSEVRRDENCVDYADDRVIMYPCHGLKGNQEWVHDPSTGEIRHPPSDQCLEIRVEKMLIVPVACNSSKLEQRWMFSNYDNRTFHVPDDDEDSVTTPI